MQNKQIIFTPSLFFQYATCPHWIWHDYFSDPADKEKMPELTLKLFEQGVLHEEDYIKDLEFISVKTTDPKKAFETTLALMKSGTPLIYQGEIEYQADEVVYRGRPDLLKKIPGQSKFGDYLYTPVDIKSSKDIHAEQKYQLVIYGIILEQLQGVFPNDMAIINKHKETIIFEPGAKDREKVIQRTDDILAIIKGRKPPLKLVSTCKSSPWYKKCVTEAEEKKDIALIYRLDARSYPMLRECGINTIMDVANMDVSSLPKIPQCSRETLDRIKLQAQSLLDGELKWLAKPQILTTNLKLFFDIEGDPLLQVQYLFGFWVVGDPDFEYAKIGQLRKYPELGKYFIYFLAETPEEEQQMWETFIQWLKILPQDEYTVYHYANYEKTWTSKLAENYGGSAEFNNFHSKLFDLENVRKEAVIFPLYFYSIKDIAKSRFINFKWRAAKAGGAQSIFWYEKWLEERDRNVLNDIVDYNEDDVKATEYLFQWFEKNK